MGFLDDAKKRAAKLLKGREKQVKGGIDKAADVIEKKVGKDKAATVDKVAEKVKDAVDDLGGPDPRPPSA